MEFRPLHGCPGEILITEDRIVKLHSTKIRIAEANILKYSSTQIDRRRSEGLDVLTFAPMACLSVLADFLFSKIPDLFSELIL